MFAPRQTKIERAEVFLKCLNNFRKAQNIKFICEVYIFSCCLLLRVVQMKLNFKTFDTNSNFIQSIKSA